MTDTRDRNKYFPTQTIDSYLDGYAKTLLAGLEAVDKLNLKRAESTITLSKELGFRIFSAGNGGSSSIAEHLECDWQKGCHRPHQSSMLTKCLTSNTSLLTAIANDMGYSKVFSYQLELMEAKRHEVLVLISSSGNSENIIEAVNFAKNKEMVVIGLTGFSGGFLRQHCDISLHVPVENYGVVEDCHQALMHVLAQYHDQKNLISS